MEVDPIVGRSADAVRGRMSRDGDVHLRIVELPQIHSTPRAVMQESGIEDPITLYGGLCRTGGNDDRAATCDRISAATARLPSAGGVLRACLSTELLLRPVVRQA